MAQLTFFFDRCTGSAFPQMLGRLRAPFGVEFHDDRKHGFKHETPDDEWLSAVCSKKWVVVSHDKRFHSDSLAIEAVKQHSGRVFYLDGGSSVAWDKLRRFVVAYKRICAIVDREKAPFIYRVTYGDKIIRAHRFE